MAITKSGILGNLNGSLDGVTVYSLKGQQIIRQKAVNVADPNTPSQQSVRNNLIFALEVYKILKPLLILSLRQREKKQNVLSEFLRLNLNKSIVNSELDFDKLVIFKPNANMSAISLDYYSGINNLVEGTILEE